MSYEWVVAYLANPLGFGVRMQEKLFNPHCFGLYKVGLAELTAFVDEYIKFFFEPSFCEADVLQRFLLFAW